MAGNILYIPYTAFLVIGMMATVIMIVKYKSQKTVKQFLTITIPVCILILLYFWNLDFNNYIKSYLFSSHAYECEYSKELEELSIPLPERTVLKGRDDFCSPFYITYADDNDFIALYQVELKKLKSSGEIEEYTYMEIDEDYWSVKKGFVIELSSGSEIESFIYQYEDSNEWYISVDYKYDVEMP